jgi:carbon-monoxide dehydrogenase medium subunit
MIALGASVVAQGPRGRRVIPVAEFVTGPFQNVLDRDEIVVEAIVPAPKGNVAGGYLKLERRVGDFATASVGISLETMGARVLRAGIGLAGVAGSTLQAEDAEQVLTGAELTADTIARAAELTAEVARPRTDHRGSADYKRHVVRTFTTRILKRISDDLERAA